MTLTELKNQLSTDLRSVDFKSVIQLIDESYEFSPTEFSNGKTLNKADTNNGSCKIFAFAKLQAFSESHTLALFGDYYWKDVLENPTGDDHQNIRNFITHGWKGINFVGDPLKTKN